MKTKIIHKSQNQLLPLLLLLLLPTFLFSQSVGIGAVSFTPDASAMLEVSALNKGTLLTRVALTGTGDVTTIPSLTSSPATATGLLVYNTATTLDVTPGYYYWNGSAWIRFSTSGGCTTPAQPSAITGDATACANTSKVYSIISSGATSYQWTVPTGWSITGGNGTISLTVTTGNSSQSGNVNVKAINSCSESSPERTLAVTVNPIPNVVATPSSQSICSDGTTATATDISLSSSVSGTNFSWTVAPNGVTGSSSSSGGFSSIAQTLTYSASPGTATYTITPTASGCSGTPTNVIVTVAASATNGGCGNSANCISAPSGEYTVLRFNTPAAATTWVVPCGVTNIEFLVVAGGGSGNSISGGGAGGLIYNSSLTVIPGSSYSVIVGAGGTGGSLVNNGSDSQFGSYIAKGGGAGGASIAGGTGGSGGGSYGGTFGLGTCGQGNNGGVGGGGAPYYGGGGGGGAGEVGQNAPTNYQSGRGGNGLSYSITGSSVTYAGGGGASATQQGSTAGAGGCGGGGAGATTYGGIGTSGTSNTGGGGGGAHSGIYGAGGSGVVIIRYLTP